MSLNTNRIILIPFAIIALGISVWYYNTNSGSIVYGQALTSTSNESAALDLLYLERLYDSPTTLVLRGQGDHFEPLGKAIDAAKQNGFSVDSVTVFTEQSQVYGNTRYLTDIYTVFMSKR